MGGGWLTDGVITVVSRHDCIFAMNLEFKIRKILVTDFNVNDVLNTLHLLSFI